jgi:hypothetical protein
MWYAVTANPVKRSRKQERKEFTTFSGEVVMSLEAGIKLVEARSSGEARRKSRSIHFYFTDTGQYSFF